MYATVYVYAYVYEFVYVSMLLSDCNVWGRIHFGNLFLENWTWRFGNQRQNKHFSENGFPGQTTMLTTRASKFWVEPRSPFSIPRDLSPKILPLPECQPELSSMSMSHLFHVIFILFSHFCEICDFFMLNTGWMYQHMTDTSVSKGPPLSPWSLLSTILAFTGTTWLPFNFSPYMTVRGQYASNRRSGQSTAV